MPLIGLHDLPFLTIRIELTTEINVFNQFTKNTVTTSANIVESKSEKIKIKKNILRVFLHFYSLLLHS